jgi:4-hydroxymandelate oxidase
VQRAEQSGCRAICITVDYPVCYSRDRVAKLGKFADHLPLGNLPGARGFGLGQATRDRAFTWKDIAWFRSFTKCRIVLKGILRAGDAAEAVKHGVDAIVVSNHGGRALDSVPATIEALPRVAESVAGKIPVLMDGGIRRGTDILKALALGARAVLIGRPYLFGLAVDGADGVQSVVQILRAELETAMALTGRKSIAEVDDSVLVK